MSNAAATGLTALAKQLNIKKPTYNEDKISKMEFVFGPAQKIDALKINDDDDDDGDLVTFIAGGNATASTSANDSNITESPMDEDSVRFSGKLLTENSDVFNRMFNSNFKESKDKRVILKNQSIDGIKYFLECIEQIAANKPLRKPIKSSDDDTTNVIVAVLEAYDMSQIYMLPELEKDILNIIVFMLSADNVLDVFHFSIQHHKEELTEISVNFYLTSNIASDIKVAVFRKADDSEYYKEWNQVILDTVVFTCQNLVL